MKFDQWDVFVLNDEVAPSHEGAWIEIWSDLDEIANQIRRPLTRGGVD